jgi:hypothetical protein
LYSQKDSNSRSFTPTTFDGKHYHFFRQILPIFGEKIGVFLKKQCHDPILATIAVFFYKIRTHFFGENIFKSQHCPPLLSLNFFPKSVELSLNFWCVLALNVATKIVIL